MPFDVRVHLLTDFQRILVSDFRRTCFSGLFSFFLSRYSTSDGVEVVLESLTTPPFANVINFSKAFRAQLVEAFHVLENDDVRKT